MPRLDADRAREALGERLGRFLVSLAGAGVPRDLSELEGRITEYLRFLEEHLRIDRSGTLKELVDLEDARKLAEAHRALVKAVSPEDEELALLVTAAVRYFVTPTDLESDLEERGGFRDDLEVLAFVIRESGLDVPVPEIS